MAENKKPMKASNDWYNFIEKFGINRIKAGTDNRMRNLCDLPDIIMKYFKENNDRYLEIVERKLEVNNGTN